MEAYAQALLIAIPFFIVLMLIEILYGYLKGFQTYTVLDTISSISSGLTNIIKDSLGLIIVLVSYPFLMEHLSITSIPSTWAVYLVAFIVMDFASYWNHRLNHRVNVFWNLHVIHHSSEEFNLACALRQPISNIFGFFALFLIPAAVLGVPNEVIQLLAPVHLFMQFWYHTKHIPKLGWAEYILVTPSQHRVHHAINKEYIDKNLSAIFCVWDRWFGTFQEELDEVPPVYGVLKPARTWNPLLINFQHLWRITLDAFRTKNWWDKIRIWWMPTGWRPDDVLEAYPISIIEDPYSLKKYETTYGTFFPLYFIIQMLFCVFLMLFMFANFSTFESQQLLLFGGVIFLSIVGYTSLMDRNNWAVYFELVRSFLGLTIVIFYPQLLGITLFSSVFTWTISLYFLGTFLATVYIRFIDQQFILKSIPEN